jgi:hypothetical protein
MTEIHDKRAHERLTSLEGVVKAHIDSHQSLEASLEENTQLTRTISENTAEIVTLIKGVKGFRGFVLWLAPFVAAIGTIVAAIAAAWYWVKR